MTEYVAKFPFGPETIYLQAEVNPTTRKQTLSIIKQDPKTGDTAVITTMECIHTLVTTISLDELEDINEDPDKKEAFLKKTVEFRANNIKTHKPSQTKVEFLRDGHEPERGYLLDLDEQFFAFKSWVQGIAEAGLDVIALNVECFESARLQFLTSRFLLWAFIYDNPDFIFQYFNKIVKECRFEGTLHRTSLWANLNLLTYAIGDSHLPKSSEIPRSYIEEYARMVFELDVDYVFDFLHSMNWAGGSILATEFVNLILEDEALINRPDFRDLYDNVKLNDEDDRDITKYQMQIEVKIALGDRLCNKKSLQIPEFKKLFLDDCYIVRTTVAYNEEATQFEEYRTLFHDSRKEVRAMVASNQKAVKFPEYRELFTDKEERVRLFVAKNKEAVQFPEYRLLSDFPNGYEVQLTAHNMISQMKNEPPTKKAEKDALPLEEEYRDSRWEGLTRSERYAVRDLKNLGFRDEDFIWEGKRINELHWGDKTKKLTSLPITIGSLKTVEWFYLNSTDIQSLPESIGNMKSLEWLDLSSSKITTLPESIGNLQSLVVLSLSYCQLKALPESIGNLQSLELLGLFSTQLKTLPESIGRLQSIKMIDLRSNELTSLPESLGNLKSLKTLTLEENQLTSLPESFGNLKSLQTLTLDEDLLASFLENFNSLISLKELSIVKKDTASDHKNFDISLEKLANRGCKIKWENPRLRFPNDP